MNRQAIGTLAIALCCLLVVGAAATSMDAAVQTDPDEVINHDLFSVPYETDSVEDLKELKKDIERGPPDEDAEDEGGPAPDETAPASEVDEQQAESMETDREEESSGQEERDEASGGPTEEGGGDGEGPAQDPDERNFLEELLSLLRSLIGLLLSLVPILLLLTGIGLVIVHRDRLQELSRQFLTDPPAADASTSVNTPAPVPANPIERAWLEMVRVLDLEDRRSKTPREWAIEAVEAGADPAAVEELTATFEHVRYTEAPVTEELVSEVNRVLDRIRESAWEGNRS